MKLICLTDLKKEKTRIANFMELLPVEAELLQADGQRDTLT